MIRTFAIPVLCGLAASPAALATPDPTALGASIDKATPTKANDRDPALVAKAEILLDRAHVSPGEIDGLDGDNFRNAVRAFQQVNGLPVSGDLDAATWGALKRDGAPILKAYTITLADAAGPFTRAIPSNLEAMARLPGLSYTSAQSELAEKFHMSPTLLRVLNPRADFARAGTELTVADVPEMALRSGRPSVEAVSPPNPPKASNNLSEVTIVVDKPARNVRVHDRDGKFLAFYGNPTWRIVFIHLFPNCFPPLIVQATLAMGFALLTLAALSYIGLGIQPPNSEWGEMTSEGAGLMVTGQWWLSLFPGIAIVATVLIFNVVGDGLRDLLDPKMRGR